MRATGRKVKKKNKNICILQILTWIIKLFTLTLQRKINEYGKVNPYILSERGDELDSGGSILLPSEHPIAPRQVAERAICRAACFWRLG